jgi:type VI secretion system secreted protein Hcp
MRRFSIIAVAFALLALPLSASAAYEFYVQIEGTKQGKFKAECGQKEWKDAMAGIDFAYEVTTATEVGTGQASGRRQHKPIVITKEVGAASPQLFQALVQNEVLKSVLISFVETNAEGVVEVVHTIKLTNARVTSLKTFLGTSSGSKDMRLLETFSLSFQRIDIENKPGKTMASDDVGK